MLCKIAIWAFVHNLIDDEILPLIWIFNKAIHTIISWTNNNRIWMSILKDVMLVFNAIIALDAVKSFNGRDIIRTSPWSGRLLVSLNGGGIFSRFSGLLN